MTTGNDIIQRFEMFANPALAESWDHVGLQLGNPAGHDSVGLPPRSRSRGN